ncbi:cytochrome P450 [Infundibulicybe gibba]|nr:cytochrome P450 [Infundibulicybe gibba]
MAGSLITSATLVSFSLLTLWAIKRIRRRSRTTTLNGPPSPNRLFGFGIELFRVKDPASLFVKWEQEYGPVYQVPTFLGVNEVVICDPKAIAHFYSKDTYAYQQLSSIRFYIGQFFGPGIMWAEADNHKRQRKALAPAFSNNSIRGLTGTFYEAGYLLKSTWDSLLVEDGGPIDVQHWMNAFTLDTIGMAGFSHDFGALKGRTSAVSEALGSFGDAKPDPLTILMFIIGPVFPWMAKLPVKRNILFENLRKHTQAIADTLLEENRAERKADATGATKTSSVIQTLLRAETTDGKLRLSPDEVVAQVNILLMAGYETTAVSLTWALIELSRHQDIQDKLRQELSEFTQTDPTWDQLTSGLPFLDAIVCEVLRLHPALAETLREVREDVVVPLGEPTRGPDGSMIDRIFLAKGAFVRIPIEAMQRSQAFWGEDGAEFKPSRWLDDSTSSVKASDIQGHRHLLTFVDGPRACLGKMFALTEFKAALTVLIRNYTFALPHGPETKIGSHRSVLIRPKVEGEAGANVPLIVKRVE